MEICKHYFFFITRKTEKLKCQNLFFVRDGGLQGTEVKIKKKWLDFCMGLGSAFYFSIFFNFMLVVSIHKGETKIFSFLYFWAALTGGFRGNVVWELIYVINSSHSYQPKALKHHLKNGHMLKMPNCFYENVWQKLFLIFPTWELDLFSAWFIKLDKSFM